VACGEDTVLPVDTARPVATAPREAEIIVQIEEEIDDPVRGLHREEGGESGGAVVLSCLDGMTSQDMAFFDRRTVRLTSSAIAST